MLILDLESIERSSTRTLNDDVSSNIRIICTGQRLLNSVAGASKEARTARGLVRLHTVVPISKPVGLAAAGCRLSRRLSFVLVFTPIGREISLVRRGYQTEGHDVLPVAIKGRRPRGPGSRDHNS